MELKEDKVTYVVGKRRSGKSYKTISLCLDKVLEGQNVLLASFSSAALRHTLVPIIHHQLQERNIPYSFDSTRLIFDFGDTLLELKSHDYIKSEQYYEPRYRKYFKVYDEYQIKLPDFDVISLNGQT